MVHRQVSTRKVSIRVFYAHFFPGFALYNYFGVFTILAVATQGFVYVALFILTRGPFSIMSHAGCNMFRQLIYIRIRGFGFRDWSFWSGCLADRVALPDGTASSAVVNSGLLFSN